MIGIPHFTAGAQYVRISAVTFGVTLFVAYLAVQSFVSHYGEVTSTRTVVAEPPKNAALAAAITEQVSRGLTCREEPALTDTILFQALEQTEVQVLTFEEAIAASSAREGWTRRYCV